MKALMTLTLALTLAFQPVWAQSIDDTFSSSGAGLSDADMRAANNYYNQGMADKILADNCAKLKNGCNDTTSKPGNVLGGFEEVLPQLYAVMGTISATGAAGGLGKIKMKGTDADGKQKEKSDLCIYIPMAGEAVAAFGQKQAETQIQSQAQTAADQQRASLYAVADIQKNRAKTAKIQATIYGATGACYVAYLATGAVFNAQLGIKMGASLAMSAIFFKKAANHEKYAKALREIADKLPKAGECNPYTATSCFCSQDSASTSDPSNYNRFCVPKAIANNGAAGTQTACATVNTDNTVQVDASCACKTTNTCVTTQLGTLGGQIGLSGIAFTDPASALSSLDGTITSGTIASADSLNAKTNQVLAKNDGSISRIDPTGKAKSIADKLKDLGVPQNLAGAIASARGTGTMPAELASEANPAISGTVAAAAPSSAQIPSYNNGGYARSLGNGGGENSYVDPLAALQNKGEKPSAVQIETFAEKAIREAEITKDTSRNLFDIISSRYRSSAISNPTP